MKILNIYILLVKIDKNHWKTCWLFTVWFPKEMHNTWIVRFAVRQMICTVFAPVSWVFGVWSKFWMLEKCEMLYFTALPNLFETRLHVPIRRRLKTHGRNDWTVTSDCVALHIGSILGYVRHFQYRSWSPLGSSLRLSSLESIEKKKILSTIVKYTFYVAKTAWY